MSNLFENVTGTVPAPATTSNTDAVVAEAKKALSEMKENYRQLDDSVKASAHILSDKVSVVSFIRKKETQKTILGLRVKNNSGSDIPVKEYISGVLTESVWKNGEEKVFSREDITVTFCTNAAFLGTIGNVSVKPKNELIVRLQNGSATQQELRDLVKFYPVPGTDAPGDEYVLTKDNQFNAGKGYEGKIEVATRKAGERKSGGTAEAISIAEAKAWLVYKMGSALISEYVENPAE